MAIQLHQFNNNSPDQATFQLPLEQLPALSQEFVEYFEFQEDLKETTLKGYRNRLQQFIDWRWVVQSLQTAGSVVWGGIRA